ncbi:hypothetical protein L2E82_06389 [Cichorium intybus]|uniref:Uncharacterized protein n=1 Tax=Cichorium intybus TaxID=13427 RepID=A0ACB9HC38_CICIN|nr:hypothetical protein L2E82_06389 [Cichorium intybus]
MVKKDSRSSEEEFSGEEQSEKTSDEEVEEWSDDSISLENSPEVESNYHAREGIIRLINDEIQNSKTKDRQLVLLQNGQNVFKETSGGENQTFKNQIEKGDSPSFSCVGLADEDNNGPVEEGIYKTDFNQTQLDDRDDDKSTEHDRKIKKDRRDPIVETIPEKGDLGGLSDKMKFLLCKDTPLGKKLEVCDTPKLHKEEKRTGAGFYKGTSIKWEKIITRSQSKQLLNKEVNFMRYSRDNQREDSDDLSNEVSQRLEEVGDLCGFKISRGKGNSQKNQQSGGKQGLELLNTHHHKSTPKSIVTPKSINATRSSTTPRNRHHPPPMLNHGTPPPITRSAYHYLSVHVSSEVTGCKLIRKENSSYGFVDYFDRRYAALAIVTLNGKHLFGQPIKVNWAYASSQREDTSGHFNIFVGDLSPEITDAMLFSFFSVYSTCFDARVMWDQKTGRSRRFGFVSFRNQQDAKDQGNIARWRKKEGDKIEVGDIISEIETDKGTLEFECIEEGYLAKIITPEGSKGVQVGQPIAITVEDPANVEKMKSSIRIFMSDSSSINPLTLCPAVNGRQKFKPGCFKAIFIIWLNAKFMGLSTITISTIAISTITIPTIAISSTTSGQPYAVPSPYESYPDQAPAVKRKLERKYSKIDDNYYNLEQVTDALARAGWSPQMSFHRRSLHHIGVDMNPYEEAISITGRTLSDQSLAQERLMKNLQQMEMETQIGRLMHILVQETSTSFVCDVNLRYKYMAIVLAELC